MTQKHNVETHPQLNATAEIVASYVLNHKMEDTAELEALIERVYHTVNRLENSPTTQQVVSSAGVSIEDSITPDYLICLEDGKKLKMLKRYLKNSYDMTPEEYRKRWNLPANYPMVAPNYAKKRSQLAKDIGLGKQPTAPKGNRKKKYTKPASRNKKTSLKSLPNGKLEIVKTTDVMRAHVV